MKFVLKKAAPISALLIGLLFFHVAPGGAQDVQPAGPIYIVQTGDTLSNIALRFGVTVGDLVAANGLEDADSLFVGDRLLIPGLDGISGLLETAEVAPGENLRSLSRIHQIPMNTFIRLNRLVSPAELHKGASLVLTRGESLAEPFRLLLPAGESLLELAVRTGRNPWAISETNGAKSPLRVVPGDVLLISAPGDGVGTGMPPPIQDLQISPLYQGETAVIQLSSAEPLTLSGRLGSYDLDFMKSGGSEYVSLQGLHALLDPGMLPFRLQIGTPDGRIFVYTQLVRVLPRAYAFEYISVDPALLDPATTEAEIEMLLPTLNAITTEKQWGGPFKNPTPFTDCINSTFGNRRSYNGSAFAFYHSGVDLCGGVGVEISAPASGTVVFADSLEVRGNLTIIDHGWGVLTAYMHQSKILVQVGDKVMMGQVIGLVGTTGRSTGPHLHWELWVHGVPVNPLNWLAQTFP